MFEKNRQYFWDEFKKNNYLDVFVKFPDKKIFEYAEKILSCYLMVSKYYVDGQVFSFESIDWGQFSDSPNSFQLYLQGLGPVQVLSTAYYLTENSKYLNAAIKLLESWKQYRCNPEVKSNPYVWHDHSVAIRAHGLVMLAIASSDLPPFYVPRGILV